MRFASRAAKTGRAAFHSASGRRAHAIYGSIGGTSDVDVLFSSGGFATPAGRSVMTLGTILIIIAIIYLLGGWSGRLGGYGYGYGHSGMGLGGVILVVLLVLLLLGKL